MPQTRLAAKTVSLELDTETHARIEPFAEVSHCALSVVVNQAISQGIAQQHWAISAIVTTAF